jgi:phosphatidylserine/phosphatidylglycerophosphate/cardiolipin synthase-like enzyme
MRQQPITTPIALSRTNRALITLPWFVQRAEYAPQPCTFHPLVNGEEAFGDLHDTISAAQKTVDIICWGFQPSMFFKRGARERGTPCIGDLLEAAGKRGVKVRLLSWGGEALGIPGMSDMGDEPNLPDRMHQHPWFSRPPNPRVNPKEFNRYWHWRAARTSPTAKIFKGPVPSQVMEKLPGLLGLPKLVNVEFVVRDFGLSNRLEIAFRTALWGTDDTRSAGNKAQGGAIMGAIVPTHHQKMVLVDYELPDRAVGYVMGHNMLDPYWDKDDHSAVRLSGDQGRNGATPRQDISSRVTGPVLRYLNQNFCEAWDRATGEALQTTRKPAATALKMLPKTGVRVMAQVLRTQPEHGKFDIEKMYLQVVNNACSFVYIENQYFRFPPLAEQIKAAAAKQIAWGRDPGEHGPIHLFVVTNASDEGIGPGTVNTYRMLEALGRADTIPGVAKLERQDKRREALQKEYDEAVAADKQARGAMQGAEGMRPYVDAAITEKKLAEAIENLRQAREKQAELVDQMKAPQEAIAPSEIPGLKVHVCTLIAPDSPPGKWEHVYVHSKLMIIDDVFMTLGSANINTRSMAADSELNICHEHTGVTGPLRKRLWGIHTGGKGAQEDIREAFRRWARIITKNKDHQKNGRAPVASLIEFYRDDPKRTHLD